jgi:DNA-binding GntR family transcriptional regulator
MTMDDPRLYMRIIDELRTRIGDGRLKPRDQVPSITVLCAGFGCSRRTVTKAMTLLAGEGLVTRVPGLGYYVC